MDARLKGFATGDDVVDQVIVPTGAVGRLKLDKDVGLEVLHTEVGSHALAQFDGAHAADLHLPGGGMVRVVRAALVDEDLRPEAFGEPSQYVVAGHIHDDHGDVPVSWAVPADREAALAVNESGDVWDIYQTQLVNRVGSALGLPLRLDVPVARPPVGELVFASSCCHAGPPFTMKRTVDAGSIPRSDPYCLHPYCLHLFRCLDGDVTPEFSTVIEGVRGI